VRARAPAPLDQKIVDTLGDLAAREKRTAAVRAAKAAPRLTPASSVQRYLARLVDAVVAFPIAVAVFLGATAVFAANNAQPPQAFLVVAAVIGFLALLVATWVELLLFGTTIGKKALGLVVVSRGTGQPSSRCSLLMREAIFGTFSAVPFVNFLSMLIGTCCGGEYFHDSILDTRVVVVMHSPAESEIGT
jgi:uncharacterized RDD family membrane protein YckC